VTILVVFTVFAVVVMSGIGLLLSGISALKQARLAKRMFNMRFKNEQRETSDASESNG
jgi:hypothetical protein